MAFENAAKPLLERLESASENGLRPTERGKAAARKRQVKGYCSYP